MEQTFLQWITRSYNVIRHSLSPQSMNFVNTSNSTICWLLTQNIYCIPEGPYYCLTMYCYPSGAITKSSKGCITILKASYYKMVWKKNKTSMQSVFKMAPSKLASWYYTICSSFLCCTRSVFLGEQQNTTWIMVCHFWDQVIKFCGFLLACHLIQEKSCYEQPQKRVSNSKELKPPANSHVSELGSKSSRETLVRDTHETS